MEKPLLIVITFDTDYDFYYTPQRIYSQTKMEENMLSWNSLEEGIPIINESLRTFQDSYNNPIHFTWFLLSDKRLKEVFNDYTYIYKKYNTYWTYLKSIGDELALHIHLIEKKQNLWIQEINDDLNIITVNELYNQWKKVISLNCIRFGYCYQSNRIMKLITDLKFKIDSSALPKRKMEGKQYFDWYETPETPFFPSITNYKIPAKDHLNILEFPFSVFLSKLKDDMAPTYRYLNLSFHPHIIKDAIKNIVRNKLIFHSITHFFEFLPKYNLSNNENLLLAFKKDSLIQNLNLIVEECKNINRPYIFLRMSEILKYKEEFMV